MYKKLFLTVFVLVAMALSANVWAGDIEVGVGVKNTLTQEQAMAQQQEANAAASAAAAAEARAKANANANNKINYKSVTFPQVGAISLNPPNTPLSPELLLNQWNESGFNEIFCSFPTTINAEMIQVVIAEKGNGNGNKKESFEKIRGDVFTDTMIFRKYSATKEVVPVLGIDPCFKEGIDFQVIGRLIYVAKNKEVSKDWIAIAAVQDAMRYGGDLLIPTGEGAERIFKNKASLLSFLGAVANSGGSAAFNIAPGLGIGGGENSIKVFPFMRVKVIRILNWEKFGNPERFCENCALKSQSQIVEETKICNPDPIREKIADLNDKISRCKNWGINNMRLRFAKANAFVDLAICTGENGYFFEAIKDYALAEKNYLNGRDISAHQSEADQLLAQVYYNWAGAIVETQGQETAVAFAQQKRLSKIPSGLK